MFQQAAASINFDWPTTFCQICQESGFDPDASSGQADGVAQFTPATWQQYGGGGSVWDPQASATAWAAYMSQLSSIYGGNVAQTLAAYNAGPGNVNTAVSRCGSNFLNCLPTSAANQAQTQNYVNSILACAGSGAAPGGGGSVLGIQLPSLPDISSIPGLSFLAGIPSWALIGAAAVLAYFYLE
jgi:hypothetical protein